MNNAISKSLAIFAAIALAACSSAPTPSPGPDPQPTGQADPAPDPTVSEGTGGTAGDPETTETTPPEPVEVPPPKIALVLGGGGARGFAHVGVLRVLEQEKIPISMIVGTSVGSLIGALYASEPNTFELEWKAFKIEKDDLFDLSIFSAKTGPAKGEAIQEFLRKNIKQSRIEDLSVPFTAVAADLNSGKRVEFTSGSIVDAVRASTSIPGVFSPHKVGNQLLVDGGVIANVAVDTARKLGADIVIAANITEKVTNYQVNDLLDIILQAINIMMGEMTKLQIEHADVVVTPDIGNVGTMDFTQKKRCMAEGIRATQGQIPALRKAIGRYYKERGGVAPSRI